MSVKKLTLAVLMASATLGLTAQETMTTSTPAPGSNVTGAVIPGSGAGRSFTGNDMWELGVHLGTPMIIGDVDSELGFGGGLHLRKSFDHIFSVRIVGLYAQMKNETTGATPRVTETNWISGSAQLVAALNNLRFNRPYRRVVVNGIFGVGASSFQTDYRNVQQVDPSVTNGTIDDNPNFFAEFGAGLAFRFNRRFNLGLEYTVMTVFGENSDLLDADQNVGSTRTTFRDYLHYPHLSLNFNLGGASRSEPLYWVNPLTQVADAIASLEARPIYNPTDTDGDGIIDDIDDEDNSPAGARVDTRGRTLDSDADGVADYRDKEPFSPPGYTVNEEGVANVPKPITEEDVNRIVDAKLANFKVPSGMVGFLPNVNFALNSYDIPYSQYEKLYQIASVLKGNEGVRLVTTGHADKTGPAAYNEKLSANRANAVIEFLAAVHGISRDRLILDFAGEEMSIIPVQGANMTNRRVEFRTAQGSETGKTMPEGAQSVGNPGSRRWQGNKAGM